MKGRSAFFFAGRFKYKNISIGITGCDFGVKGVAFKKSVGFIKTIFTGIYQDAFVRTLFASCFGYQGEGRIEECTSCETGFQKRLTIHKWFNVGWLKRYLNSSRSWSIMTSRRSLFIRRGIMQRNK